MELKSKEEILAAKNWNSEYPNYMAEDQILEAMDEWAKLQCIVYEQWLLKRIFPTIMTGQPAQEASEALYNQFIESQSKL